MHTSQEQSSNSRLLKLGAGAAALALTAALLFGYLHLNRAQKSQLAQSQSTRLAAENAPPKAQIFQDEVRLKGAQALVSGIVKNISEERLENLSVAIELRRRQTQETATRTLPVEPGSLEPGQSGRYSLQIPSGDWAGVRVTKLVRAGESSELPFKPEVGERRPHEPPPPTGKVIVVERPRRKGDDFLNTPDNPFKIP